MVVLVLSKDGKPLMPCSPRRARLLVKQNLATVVDKLPYKIQLNYGTRGYTQETRFAVDTGEQHIGICLAMRTKVLMKMDIELRKSMDKRKLMVTRQEYRRSRRCRKTRYRHPKFKHKTIRRYQFNPKKNKMMWMKVQSVYETSRPEGWLPPSIQSKVNHHIFWINKFLSGLPEKTKLIIEVAKFDIQHMQDPNVRGELYQLGRMYGYENVKSYVLAKFNYTCPICKHKFDKDHKPRLHHTSMRKYGATDNPDEFAPVCEKCHTNENHLPDGVLDKLRLALKRKEYREPTFMNILRHQMFRAFPDAEFTYGNITSADRQFLGLGKTHANDAVAIAMHHGILNDIVNESNLENIKTTIIVKQVRKKKRSLHEATPRKGRKHPNKLAMRNAKNTKYKIYNNIVYSLHDKVSVNGQIGYISGFHGHGAYVKTINGSFLVCNSNNNNHILFKHIKIIKHNNNWICEII